MEPNSRRQFAARPVACRRRGHGRPAEIEGGVKTNGSWVEEGATEKDEQKLRERLAQLVGGVAARGMRS